jgi:hypothetical protein
VDESRKWERYGALSGILFVILVIVSIAISGSVPMASDSATKIFKYFRDHQDSIEAAAFIGGLATVPVLWWAGSLWARMRRAENGQPRLALIAVLGLVFAGAGQLIASALTATIALERNTLSASAAKFFFVLSLAAGAAGTVGIAVLVLATSALVFRTRVFPMWLGWLGIVDAVLLLIASYSVASTSDTFAGIGFAAFIIWAIWIIILSIIMFRTVGPGPEVLVEVAVVEETTVNP